MVAAVTAAVAVTLASPIIRVVDIPVEVVEAVVVILPIGLPLLITHTGLPLLIIIPMMEEVVLALSSLLLLF